MDCARRGLAAAAICAATKQFAFILYLYLFALAALGYRIYLGHIL